MATLFDDQFSDGAMVDMLASFGETVTYTDSLGNTHSITAIFRDLSQESRSYSDGRGILHRCEFLGLSDDLAGASIDETITRSDSTVWTVESTTIAGGSAKLGCARYAPTKSGKDYAINRR